MYPITSFTAAIATIIYIFLTIRVIKLREKHNVSLGLGDNPQLELAIRAHGNFAEYTPLSLILILCAEAPHRTTYLLVFLALCLIVGRISHAYAFLTQGGAYRFRAIGMVLTFFSLAALALLNLGLLVF